MSKPVECYEFQIEGFGTYRLTSANNSQTFQGQTYFSQPGLSCDGLSVPISTETNELTVKLPATSTVARLCGLLDTPKRITLIIRRYNVGALLPEVIYRSVMKSAAIVKGDTCTIKFPPAMRASFELNVPSQRVQATCNHQLFDSGCRLSDATAKQVMSGAKLTQYTAIPNTNNRYQIELNAPVVVATFKGGTLRLWTGVWHNRTISLVEGVGTTHLRVALNSPLPAWGPSSIVEIRPGCDNSYQRCLQLGNTVNFGGFPAVPTEKQNPNLINIRRNRWEQN